MDKESPAAKSFKDTRGFLTTLFHKKIELSVQIIKPIVQGNVKLAGTVEEVLGNFDFTVSRCAIRPDKTVLKDVDFDKDETAKKLSIKAIHCPISEVYQVGKYMKKGYFCPITDILLIFKDWEDRGDDYRGKIREVATKEDPTEEDILHLEKMLHID